jgi:hypothetical protein
LRTVLKKLIECMGMSKILFKSSRRQVHKPHHPCSAEETRSRLTIPWIVPGSLAMRKISGSVGLREVEF